MKTNFTTYWLILMALFITPKLDAQQVIVGYSGLFTINTVGAQLTADFTIDTTGFTGKMVGGSSTGFVYDINQSIQFLDKTVGAALPNNWTWNFGDGSPVVNTQNPTHAFSRPGNYTVNLCVANQSGVADDVVKTDYIVVGQPNYGIELEIIETGGTNEVKWVGYKYWNHLLELTTVNNFPVQNHKALISWDSKINGQTDFNDEIILYGETNGVKKQIGHIFFEYEHAIEKEYVRNAIIIFHNTGMEESFPYGPGKHEYDWRWDYYKKGEFPVSMLIPPNNIFQETYSKTPLLLIHGWEGKFSLERNPDAKADQNETSYWFTTVSILNKESSPFDTWQYYYPYNSAHDHLAICLKNALSKLKTYYPDKKIRLVTHSMGGLVTLNYMTQYRDSAKLKVEKVLFLAPPAHGSLGANLFYKTPGSIGLQPLLDYDRHAPSPRDMKLGSNTNWGIQNTPFPDLDNNPNGVADDYFVLLGTTFKYYKSDTYFRAYMATGYAFGPHFCLHEEAANHHDGIVSISSGSLLDKGIGFATFHGNHVDAAHMQSFKRDDLANQNIGNADLLPDIITEYFTQDAPTFINWMKNNQDITTIVTSNGDNREVLKPEGPDINLGNLTTNNGVDYQKGILNIEFSENPLKDRYWAYYNSSEKKLSLRKIKLPWPYTPIGIFIQNENSDGKRRYYFNDDKDGTTGKNSGKGEFIYNGCAMKLLQGENTVVTYNFWGNPATISPFNFKYCETTSVTIGNSNKSKNPNENSTDNKENLIVSTGTTVSDTLLASFFIDDQTTSVNFNVSAEELAFNGFPAVLKMKLPDGTPADSTFVGSTYHFDHELGLITMEIPNPMPGQWHVWLESDYPGADQMLYNAVAYLQSEVYAWLPDTTETVAAHKPSILHAGLKVNDFDLASGLNVHATVNRPDGENEVFDISSNLTTQDSSYIFALDYSFELPGEYLIKYNIDGVYNNYNFERCLYFSIEAIDTIPVINIPDIVLRQQESQQTLNLSQYIYNVEDYDTLYFSSEIIASNLDSLEFTATLDSLALSAYLTTNLADTGTVTMRYSCHFDDQVISDTIEIRVLLPELIIESAQLSNSNMSNETDFVINCSLKNTGNFDAGSYEVKYFISEDSIFQPTDFFFFFKTKQNHYVDSLVNITDTLNVPLLLLEGNNYFLVITDANHQINETDETNNQKTLPVNLNSPPAPPSIISAIPGNEAVHLTWTSNNQTGITGYVLSYGLDTTGVLTKIYTLNTDTTRIITGLAAGNLYYFAVQAYRLMGEESELSAFASATPYEPELSVSPTTLDFGNVAPYDSLILNYQLTGIHLIENVTITATTGFLVSTQPETGFASAITVDQINGVVNQAIYVKFSPSNGGTFNGTLTNVSGSVQANVTVNGVCFLALCTAVDNCELTFTTGGNEPWFGQPAISYDGVDAAQSGTLTDSQESWMETTIVGQGKIGFWWKVSSELDYDYLNFYINGVLQDRISGTLDWQFMEYYFGNPTNTLNWSYTKDGSVTSGLDAGLVDQVLITYAILPTISTTAVTDIEFNSANSGGNITHDGYAPVTARGIVWSTLENPAIENNQGFTNDGNSIGQFVSSLTGLSPETTYFVRAYASNIIGTGYGEQLTFTTPSAPEIAVNPGYLVEAHLSPGQITTQTLLISNTGGSALNFVINKGISPNMNTTRENSIRLRPRIIEKMKSANLPENLIRIAKAQPGGASPNQTDEATIRYDNGVNFDAIGIATGGTFQVAAYFPASTMEQYDGMTLTKLEFYIKDIPTQCVIKIYGHGTGSTPGVLLHSQAVTPTPTSWNIFELSSAIPITGEDLWIGYEVNHPENQFIAGCDAGPSIAGFGDLLYYEGTWASLSSFGLEYNWNLVGYLNEDLRWLTISPTTGILQPGESTNVEVTFDATNLTQGVYTTKLNITCNDPVTPTLEIPVQLTVQGDETQTISLPQGWSGLSSYLSPSTDNIEPLFQPILSDLIILQNTSGIYWPGQNINTLGAWNTHEGYQIKVANAVDLTISGLRENNKTLQLATGWNLIPVLSECEVDVAVLFAGKDVVIVKEVAGWNIYWPEFGINSLGALEPGKAYFVLMGSAGNIEFPVCGSMKLATYFENLTASPDLTAFGIKNTPITHTIAIPEMVANSLSESDIISVYDENGNCFGMVNWQSQTTAITLFGDDPTTNIKDGFDENEPLKFRLYRQNADKEFEMEVTLDSRMPNPERIFNGNGLSVITEMMLLPVGISSIEPGFEVLTIPNPAKDEFTLVIGDRTFEKGVLTIYTIDGRFVKTENIDSNHTKININELRSGVYLLKIEFGNKTVNKRLIIK